ncbi:endonuclease NucS [Candidatus Woesearchaeota archaeon CG10_big_fil_rev_8_21_14_0_10_32_9]|nr:MAG: endonuclease NucS [Candidatus Woesearchaeota archaeon CG10_big_fil_rev_8_21_14_0_10_32_9]
MKLAEFKEALEKALSSNQTSSFFCKCSIFYNGRAEAELEEGERLIIIKADNTILVHQPEGSTPINYMKNDSSIELILSKDHVHLKSYNQKFKDYLEIEITKVYSFSSYKLEDGKKLNLVGNERDMSDMLKDNPKLISKDFKPLSREEHTKFGFIDVFGHDNKGNLILIECKRYTAGVSAVQQLRRYVEKIIELKGLKKETVKGILAAPNLAKNAEEMMQKWGFTFVSVEPPKRLEKYKKNQKNILEFS